MLIHWHITKLIINTSWHRNPQHTNVRVINVHFLLYKEVHRSKKASTKKHYFCTVKASTFNCGRANHGMLDHEQTNIWEAMKKDKKWGLVWRERKKMGQEEGKKKKTKLEPNMTSCSMHDLNHTGKETTTLVPYSPSWSQRSWLVADLG